MARRAYPSRMAGTGLVTGRVAGPMAEAAETALMTAFMASAPDGLSPARNSTDRHGGDGHHDDGFSLIEALVAMAVLAVGAVSLLAAVETHAARVTDLSDRIIARWVAENRLTALRLDLPDLPARVAMMGQDWNVATDTAPTADPALVEVTIRAGKDDATLAMLTGFIDAGSVDAGSVDAASVGAGSTEPGGDLEPAR